MFSIGHSTHPIDRFISLLKMHGVEVVVDVRSSPFSKYNPQFNKENIARSLKGAGIKYLFMGKDLGARPVDPSCYDGRGKVRYELLALRDGFKHAISRLLRGAEVYRVSLMCSEREPLECHRTLLVSQTLFEAGCAVKHILQDGSLENHDDTLDRLLRASRPDAGTRDLFDAGDGGPGTMEQLRKEALSKQESRIAHVNSGPRNPEG